MKKMLWIAMIVILIMIISNQKVKAESSCNVGVLATNLGTGFTAGCEGERFGLSVFSTKGEAKTENLEVKTAAQNGWSPWQINYNLSTEPTKMIAVMGDIKLSPRVRLGAGAAQIKCGAKASGESEAGDSNLGGTQPYWRTLFAKCSNKLTPAVSLSFRQQLFKRVIFTAGVSYLWLKPTVISIENLNDLIDFSDGTSELAPGRQEAQDRFREATEISPVLASVALVFKF